MAKQPTNSDIIKKLDHMDIRLGSLENWKIAEDAAKAAVSSYKQGEDKNRRRKLTGEVSQFLVVLTLLVWAVVEYLARVHK